MNSHLPMLLRSRLMTVDSVAMPRKIRPVPVNAVMISPAPLPRPSTAPIRRDSIKPMKNVKPSSTGTPAAEFFVFSIANIKPKAPPRKTIRLMPGPIAPTMPVLTPIHAPSTVGTIESASSQYVLRRTRLRSASDIATASVAGKDGLQALVHGTSRLNWIRALIPRARILVPYSIAREYPRALRTVPSLPAPGATTGIE